MLHPRSLGLAVLVASLAFVELAAAATIRFDPTSTTDLAPGERIALEILGSDFAGGSAGGGLDLSWNPDVLGLAAADIELLFPGDRFVFDTGTLGAGTLTNLATNSFNGVASVSFSIARLTFTALAAGTSSIELALGSFTPGGRNVWTTATGEEITDLAFEAASVTVVAPVPAPAAIYLLPGALAALAARRRHSRMPAID